MQDEVNEKTIALCIKGAHISADMLRAAMRKYLNEMEKSKDAAKQQKNQVKTAEKAEHAKQRAKRAEAKKNAQPQGKQTMQKLVGQGSELTNIEITNNNVKSFDRVARKYGVDYSLKKDTSKTSPRYMVFFKARDVDVMTAAFKEYAGISMKKQKKVSIKKKLSIAKQKVANKQRQRVKVNQKDRGQSL